MKLSSGTLSPSFKYNVTKYTATVGYDVTKVVVSAKTSNEKATIESVTGDGTVNLKVGDNVIEIVVKAENGVKAVEKYNELKPDLVLMDITMPEMDGIQALKNIKAADSGAKVIMCSAMGQQAMVIESIQAGAKDFIVKPFQAERVLEAVKKVVG